MGTEWMAELLAYILTIGDDILFCLEARIFSFGDVLAKI